MDGVSYDECHEGRQHERPRHGTPLASSYLLTLYMYLLNDLMFKEQSDSLQYHALGLTEQLQKFIASVIFSESNDSGSSSAWRTQIRPSAVEKRIPENPQHTESQQGYRLSPIIDIICCVTCFCTLHTCCAQNHTSAPAWCYSRPLQGPECLTCKTACMPLKICANMHMHLTACVCSFESLIWNGQKDV